MTKICIDCFREMLLDEFPRNGSSNGKLKLSSRCRPCKRTYDNIHYQKNRLKRDANSKIYAKKARERQSLLVWAYLKVNPCNTCGETDPVVLEFDHRLPKDKFKNISSMVGKVSEKRLLDEIAKCDVLCANCHRRRTAKQQGWAILNRDLI